MVKRLLTLLLVSGLFLAACPAPAAPGSETTTGSGDAASAPAASGKELSIAHFMSPKHPMHAKVMEPMSVALGEVSDGNLTARVYPGGELGSGPVEQYNRAVDGVADIAFGIPEYTPAIFPKTGVIALPGVGKSEVDATNALWSVKEEYLADEFARVHLLALWAFDGAILMSVDKPIRSLADLEGMKMRSPGAMGTKVLEAWGATPVNMPISEAYNALSTGVVDGIMVSPSGIRSFKLNEVVNHITVNVPTVMGAQYLVMNRESWDALSEEQQAHLGDVSGEALSIQAAEAYAAASQSGLDLAVESGLEIIELDDAAIAEFVAAAQPVFDTTIAELEAGGVDGADLLAKIQSAQE